jgi:hypothetical protein
MATAEFAGAIPAVVLVLVLALSAVTTVLDQVRCVDAARAAARAVARGDDAGTARSLGGRLAPPGARIDIRSGSQLVEVEVRGSPAPALRWLGEQGVPRGHAVAQREQVDDAGQGASP